MSHNALAAKTLAKTLNLRHAELHSWRLVAAEYHSPLIKRGTLCRIAKSNGRYIPKDDAILIVLGLKEPPAPMPEWLRDVKKNIRKMVKETRNPESYKSGIMSKSRARDL